MSNLLDKIYVKNTNFPWQTMSSETIIIDPKEKSSFELNEVGSFIWNNFDGTRTLADIQNLICTSFDATENEISADLEELTSLMLKEQLIIEQA